MRHKLRVKKLIFSLALAVGLALGTAAVCSFAGEYTDYQGVKYEYSNQTASVVGNTYVSGDINIPSTITINGEDYDVTTIGESAFESCTSLTKITIPSSVTSIGNYTFKGCSNLTSVTFEDTQENPFEHLTICIEAFHSCTSLRSITLPSSVKSIFIYNAFSESLEDIYLPVTASLEGITAETFPTTTRIWRYSITNTETINGRKIVNITSEETENEKPASLNCTAMGEGYSIWHIYVNGVTLQHGSTEITETGYMQVETCTECGLQILTSEPATVHNWVEITSDWEKLDKVQNGNNYTIWTRTSTKACTLCEVTEVGTDIFVPEGYDYSNDDIPETTCIWTYSVIDGKAIVKVPTDHRDQFVNVIVPSKIGDYPVTTIDELAFAACENLQNITIPNSVTTIGESAFQDCIGLTSIEIPSSVTSIGDSAFADCIGLTSITIPSSVTSIGEMAFNDCSSLASITIQNSVTSIGDDAFLGCSSLTRITIPCDFNKSKFNYIGIIVEDNYSFRIKNGTTYGTFTYTHNLSGNHTWIPLGEGVWERDCEVVEAVTDVFVPDGYDYSNYDIPATTRIWKYSISDGKATITGIDHKNQFVDVEIPAIIGDGGDGSYAVTKIGNNVFQRCGYITSITIPSSVTSIGNYTFKGCSNLTSVMFQDTQENPSQLSMIGTDAFHSCTNLPSITLPSNVASITNNAFNQSNNLTEIKVDSRNSNYCSENGVLYNKNKTELVRYPEGKSGTSFEIPSTVTKIGGWAFGYCNNLTSITIPEGVTSIGDSAFEECSYLTNITLPSSVTSIGGSAFNGCSSLSDIYVPTGTTIEIYGILRKTRIWRYTAGEGTINSRMIVNIVSEEGAVVPTSFSLDCNSMGEDYTIKSIAVAGVTLNHVGQEIIVQDAKEATCTEIGYNAGTEVCGTCGLPTNSGKIIPATGHNYGESTYSWAVNENIATCTATRICTNDASHVEPVGTVKVKGYSGEYDEMVYEIEIIGQIAGTTVLYSEDGTNWSETAPTRTAAGTTTVYVKIQDNNDNTINLEADDSVMIKIIELGDINGDGFVNIIDLQMLYNHFAGIKMLTNVQMMPANLNNDTEINLLDLQPLLNLIITTS